MDNLYILANLISAATVVIAVVAVVVMKQRNDRALKGLDLITLSKLQTQEKLTLLSIWNSPSASKAKLNQLVRTISELEGSGEAAK